MLPPARARREREPERPSKAHFEGARAVPAVRNVGGHELVELESDAWASMSASTRARTSASNGDSACVTRVLSNTPDLLDVAIVERREDGTLVRKILVDGADADAGHLGDAVRRDAVDAVALQDLHDRVEHVLDRLT